MATGRPFFTRVTSAIGRSSAIVGAIDGVVDGRVYGWVRRRGINAPVVIDGYVNGVRVVQGLRADRLREDVKDAGYGSGRHGFEIDLPAGMLSHPSGLHVEICTASTRRAVLNRRFERASHVATFHSTVSPDGSVRPQGYECEIERLTTTSLRGWAVDIAYPGRIFDIDVLIDGALFCRTSNRHTRNDLFKMGKTSGAGGISVDLPMDFLEVGEHEVALITPDGSRRTQTIAVVQQRTRPRQVVGSADPVAIVVPVYNAPEDLEVCIERLAAYTPADADVLFVDDASPDARIALILDEAAKRPGMRVLRNSRNLGFSGTVNRGLMETAPRNVIILNSDARVTPGWVEGLQKAANAYPRIATVTPMSDRAGAFSAPDMGNENALPPGVSEIDFARAFRRRGLGLYPLVPTGNGFCMWIRRECLDEVGAFDAEAFPRGYGEENDFCMRAGRAGWRHVIDDRTYVFHDRSKSFGASKEKLIAAGRAIVDERWPEYTKVISVFRDGSKMNLARFRARQAFADCAKQTGRAQRVLYVLSTQTGGTPQTSRDLMKALGDAIDGWVLRCNSRELELCRFDGSDLQTVRRHAFAEPVDPIRHTSVEYDEVVAEWLESLNVDLVHIRQLAWHSLSLPRIAKAAGLPVVMSFHDYYTLCPTVKLMDGKGSFCGGTCTKSPDECVAELWPANSFPPLKNRWVHVWRELFGKAIGDCDAYITTSEFTRDLLLKHHPELSPDRFLVIPHGRDFAALPRLRHPPEPGEPIRVLVPGNINEAKGLDILHAVLADDRHAEIEFHILGNIKRGVHPPHPRLIAHGPYARDEFAGRVAMIGPQIGAVFSIWDETWCHTLTELWSVGLPAAVFDFPTVATRVRDSGAGWVLDHRDIGALRRELVRVARDADEIARTDAALAAWREGSALADSTRRMAADYLDSYRVALDHHANGASERKVDCEGAKSNLPVAKRYRPRVAVVCPANPSQTRGKASTEIRVWERTRNAVDRDITYLRMGPESLLASLRAGAIDAAIILRNVVPAPLVKPLLEAFEATGTPWVLDLDDQLLAVPRDKDPDGRYAAYRPFLEQLIADATEVTVSTPPLQAAIAPFARNVTLLPNRLSLRLWGGAAMEWKPDGMIRALYMGTTTHADDLAMIMPALDAVARAEPRFRLSVIGITDGALPPWAERIVVPPEVRSYHRFVPWLKEQARNADFALAPLEATEFNVCKSALKALDAGALGLPVLVSDHVAYREVLADALGVRFVQDGKRAWEKALLAQVAVGRDGGADLRDWVLANHALEPTLDAFDRLMHELIDSSQSAGAVHKTRAS